MTFEHDHDSSSWYRRPSQDDSTSRQSPENSDSGEVSYFHSGRSGERRRDALTSEPFRSTNDGEALRDELVSNAGTGAEEYSLLSEKRGPTSESRSHASSHASVGALLVSKLVWLTGTCVVFFVAWIVGPQLVEHYQYAATKARIQAEYDVAKVALNDAPLNQMSTAYRMVARRIRPSVVHISTFVDKKRSRSSLPDGLPPGFDFFGPQGQGSGVIVSEDGYILTNEHVIRDAKTITVVLSDRRTYKGELVGIDRYTDLAVLKIDANDLIPAEWGDSDQLDVGSLVWAVGSPFGLEQSISFGIISAKHRKTNENPHQDLLQSDAAVNPGNSGGPLVDEAGRVVGINTSIVGETYQGISFSVPSSLAKVVFEKIVQEGAVKRGFLGVTPGLVSAEEAESQQLNSLDGAVVRLVQDGSPAAESGLQVGDIITEWNSRPITNDILLFRHVGMTPANSIATCKFFRDGIPQVTRVRVGSKSSLDDEDERRLRRRLGRE